MQSFELHQSLRRQTVVEKLIDEVMILPMGKADARAVVVKIGEGVAIVVLRHQYIISTQGKGRE